jgi:branched-chain amino acid transport system substrate-binding protein
MNIKRIAGKRLLVVALVITLALLGTYSLMAGGETEETNTIRIGCSVALTGSLSREGNLVKDGYDLWLETINSQGGLKIDGKRYPVEIVYYDDQSNPQTSARLAEKLITEDNIKLILGPMSSGIVFAVSNITERYGAVMVVGSGNADAIYNRGYKNIFSIIPTPSKLLIPTIDMWSQQSPKPKNMAILTKDELFSLTVAEGAQQYAESIGIDVVYFAKYPVGLQDLSTFITQMKSKKPDLVVATGHVAESILFVKQAKELNFRPLAWDIQVGPEIPDFKETLGSDANYVYYFNFFNKSEKVKWNDPVFGNSGDWVKKFEAKYGYSPKQHNALASATAVLLGQAIEMAGTTDAAVISETLHNMQIETLIGKIEFDSRGVNVGGGVYTLQVQEDRDVIIWPKKVAEGEPIYPMP